MRALLLAAGFGSRLNELTKSTPKCLMEVGGQTMLDHWLGKLDKLGVTDFVINTHYLADQVDAFISTHPLCDRINVSFEPTLLGTGMSLSNHLEWLKTDDCFVVHVDNYCEDSLEGMCIRSEIVHRHVMALCLYLTQTGLGNVELLNMMIILFN